MEYQDVDGVQQILGKVPTCDASDAPHIGEKAVFGIADELSLQQDPTNYGKRAPRRVCIMIAQRAGLRLKSADLGPSYNDSTYK